MDMRNYYCIILILSLGIYTLSFAQTNKQNQAFISGKLLLDETWNRTLYLSHIPSYENMYDMSNEMIIAKTTIGDLGSFQFNIDFLPKEENLFRLHVTKKDDTPATLIIGGKDENHTFLIVNRFSNFELKSTSYNPPFRNLRYKNSSVNSAFQQISDFVYKSDSLAAESSRAKRMLIEKNMNKDLLVIADSSQNSLVSLYAIYQSKYESNYDLNKTFFTAYLKKRSKENNQYMKAFRDEVKMPDVNNKNNLLLVVIIGFILCIVAFFIGKHGIYKKDGYKKLTVQERKIFELLRTGATNQDIANEYNIGLSTVKSHVSNIYSKLNVKSRKEVMDLKLKS